MIRRWTCGLSEPGQEIGRLSHCWAAHWQRKNSQKYQDFWSVIWQSLSKHNNKMNFLMVLWYREKQIYANVKEKLKYDSMCCMNCKHGNLPKGACSSISPYMIVLCVSLGYCILLQWWWGRRSVQSMCFAHISFLHVKFEFIYILIHLCFVVIQVISNKPPTTNPKKRKHSYLIIILRQNKEMKHILHS